jgi:DNA-binding NtrC family response regulator
MPHTVLVVDDQARARRALAAELEDAGFQVLEAGDGEEAWDCFQNERPDLVITDMVMPRADGLELLSRVRSRSETPVLIFTAYGSVESAVSALKGGAQEFVVSPDVEVERSRISWSSFGARWPTGKPAIEAVSSSFASWDPAGASPVYGRGSPGSLLCVHQC